MYSCSNDLKFNNINIFLVKNAIHWEKKKLFVCLSKLKHSPTRQSIVFIETEFTEKMQQ